MESRAGLCTSLLGQQIHYIKLLEGRENGDDHSGRNDGCNRRQRDCLGSLDPVGAVQQSTFIVAAVNGLHSTIHDHDHKWQCQPQVDYGTADERRHITAEPPHGFLPKFLHPLIQQAKLGVEHAGLPQQDRNITGHCPREHQQSLVELAKFQLLNVQQCNQHKCDQELQDHVYHSPKNRSKQR